MAPDALLVSVYGESALREYSNQVEILTLKTIRQEEANAARAKASKAFRVNLSKTDVLVAGIAGSMVGIANGLFKNFIPQRGSLRHVHGKTNAPIDYRPPNTPSGVKSYRSDLHRQIGPGHDVFRFKEALELTTGSNKDFKLWGSTATKILGHKLKHLSKNPISFITGADAKQELINHLLIDFFTKRSLPIPGSTHLADSSPEMAAVMTGMYKNGANFKALLGNTIGFIILQLIIWSYVFIYKAIPQSGFKLSNISKESINQLYKAFKDYIQSNEYHVICMIAHGSCFAFDTAISVASKSYAGLLQLNYASLGQFGNHSIRYIANSTKEYRSFLKQAKGISEEALFQDQLWEHNFKTNFQKVFAFDEFIEVMSPERMRKDSLHFNEARFRLKDNSNRALKEIEEFNIDMEDDDGCITL